VALKQMPDGEGLGCVAEELMHRCYKPAEADMLALFKQLDNSSYAKGKLAEALAAFRCKEAIPEMRRWQQELQKTRKKPKHPLGGVDLALLRLTGDWGEPGDSARLFVVPPEQPRLGEKMELIIYLENSGTEHFEIMPIPREIGLRVDGQEVFKERMLSINGMVGRLDPGGVWSFTCDLTPYVKMPGRHRAQYVDHGARSNEVTFTVQASKQ
jgi:hypothetical protein